MFFSGQAGGCDALLAHYLRRPLHVVPGLKQTDGDPIFMSQDNKLVDLGAERAKRVHDLNEKRLIEVRNAFEQAMPLANAKKKPKKKPKKR